MYYPYYVLPVVVDEPAHGTSSFMRLPVVPYMYWEFLLYIVRRTYGYASVVAGVLRVDCACVPPVGESVLRRKFNSAQSDQREDAADAAGAGA